MRFLNGVGVALAFCAFAGVDVISTVPDSVARYARDLEAVQKQSGAVSLEPVFNEGLAAAAPLLRGQLEQMDAPTYQKVQSLMAGFIVGRAEVILAAPDVTFFLKLAREKGMRADRAFFEVEKYTYPDSVWPAYTNQQSDYSGCTVYDGSILTELYARWTAFRKAYPGQYRGAVQKEMGGIETALASTCACGGEDGVRKELESFLKTFPNSPASAMVAKRLEMLRQHASGIRFHCVPR
jgi:hypothetical protein